MAPAQLESAADVDSFQTVVDVAGVPIYTLDTDGRFTYVNAELVTEIGYSRSTLLGNHHSHVLSERDASRCREAVTDLIESGGRTCELTVSFETADGEWRTADLAVSLLPLDGGFQGTVGIVRSVRDGSASPGQESSGPRITGP